MESAVPNPAERRQPLRPLAVIRRSRRDQHNSKGCNFRDQHQRSEFLYDEMPPPHAESSFQMSLTHVEAVSGAQN